MDKKTIENQRKLEKEFLTVLEVQEAIEAATLPLKKIKLSEDLYQIIDNTETLYTGDVLYVVVTGSLRYAVMEAVAALKSTKYKNMTHGIIKYKGFEVEFRREDRWKDLLETIAGVEDFTEQFNRRNNNNASI